jgi:hypothetical protein
MKRNSIRPLVLGFTILVLSILSCSSPMQLFATATPTITATFTPTNTPTATSTPTATPVPPPPMTVTRCIFEEDCPEAHFFTSYLPNPIMSNLLTEVVFPAEDKMRVNVGWCTKDETALQDNLQHISYMFEIDGISYLDQASISQGTSTDETDPTISYPCSFIGVMLSGWTIGENHLVTIGVSFDAPVYDGWEWYSPTTDAPYSFKYVLDLKPSFIPTPAPTETASPEPAVPYSSPVPSCDQSSSIQISNTTGESVTLYLSGPAEYVFYLGTGDTTLSVCSGYYSYTAYGCGGASDSGSMSSGESHEFYCSGR